MMQSCTPGMQQAFWWYKWVDAAQVELFAGRQIHADALLCIDHH